MLSLYFITTTGYSLTHRLGSFFWYLNIVWAYCCHSRKAGDKRLPFFFCCTFHFYSTCFEWASLICPVTTQLLKECISSRIGLPTYTPVQQSTFLRLLRLLLYIPGGFPAPLSLTVFCTFRCFFASRVCLHFLSLTACVSSEPNSSERSTV